MTDDTEQNLLEGSCRLTESDIYHTSNCECDDQYDNMVDNELSWGSDDK